MSKDDSTGKIQWDRLIKKLSPYTVQKGLRYLKHGSLTVEYTKKCLQALWCLLFLRQIFCFIL